MTLGIFNSLKILFTVGGWLGVGFIVTTTVGLLIVSHILYTMHLKRTKPEKWTRGCSCNEPDQMKMYNVRVI